MIAAEGAERIVCDRVGRLLEAKKIIDHTLAECSEDILLLTTSKVVSTHDLLKISLQIRHAAHAPREYKIGFPLVNGHPPAPQPEQMRTGRLPAFNLQHSSDGSNIQKKADSDQSRGNLFAKRLLDELVVAKERAVMQRTEAMNARSSDEKMDMSEPPLDVADERATEAVSVQESKKARTVNISFASYDDSDED